MHSVDLHQICFRTGAKNASQHFVLPAKLAFFLPHASPPPSPARTKPTTWVLRCAAVVGWRCTSKRIDATWVLGPQTPFGCWRRASRLFLRKHPKGVKFPLRGNLFSFQKTGTIGTINLISIYKPPACIIMHFRFGM